MPRPPSLVPLVCLALFAPAWGCATLVRPSRAEVRLHAAPADLLVLENGHPVPVENRGDGSKVALLRWSTREVTLRTQGRDHDVKLETRVGVGFLVADLFLLVYPILVDLFTSKWTNFEEVPVPEVLAMASAVRPTPGPGRPAVPPPDTKPALRAAPKPAAPEREPAKAPEPPRSAPETVRVAAADPTSRPKAPVVARGKLAVLDFKSYTGQLKPEDVRYFTDVVRGASLRASPGLEVITRENLLVLLKATGRDLASCEGECEVDTGRRIGADAVISGDVLKVGTRFKLSLRLHDTHEGKLLSTAVASGKTIDELDESAQGAAQELLLR